MYSTNNDAKEDVNDKNTPQKRQTNTPPIVSNSSPPSSPYGSTLLVIDDTSDPEEVTINNNYNHQKRLDSIPNKPMAASITAQLSNMQLPTNLISSAHDLTNDTIDQKRRRNSSIAKLLGGRPLHNQQYEEIHQQILESQSAHNASNNYDMGTDSEIQRTRSSITRTLLMNNEQTNSMTKLPSKLTIPSGPSFSKDFEYLIRHELDKVDNEHGSSTKQRNNSAPTLVQNLKSSSNTNAQSKLKRKRPICKSPLPPSNIPPFSLHNPSKTDSPAINQIPSDDHLPNRFLQLDSPKRPRYQLQNPHPTNHSSYLYHKNTMNSSAFNQFNIHEDETFPNTYPSSCNYAHYSSSPMTHLSASSARNNMPIKSTTRKAKSILVRPDARERSRERSYSNESDSSLEPSSKTTVPLKKRLLDAYNNEHHPTSSL